MFKKLGAIGLAVAIALLVVSSAMADLKFYGGRMRANMDIAPMQEMTVAISASGTQGIEGISRSMAISTTEMYGVVADNEFLVRNVSGSLGKSFMERQVIAAHDTDTYKSSGLQTTVGSSGVTSFDSAELLGNNGNIQFDAAGANPTLTFTNVSQNVTDTAQTNPAPSMTQTNVKQAVLTSPSNTADTPLSLITTGDATGLVIIGSSITSSTQQDQEFSSLLAGCAGLYNGQMMKADTIDMNSLTQMGTGSVAIGGEE